jgi:uncharacterized membrane protein YsdA (DUF1294 family)
MKNFHHKNKKQSFQTSYFLYTGGNLLLLGLAINKNSGLNIIRKLIKK